MFYFCLLGGAMGVAPREGPASARGRRTALLWVVVAAPRKATKPEKLVILLLERYLRLLRHLEVELRWEYV